MAIRLRSHPNRIHSALRRPRNSIKVVGMAIRLDRRLAIRSRSEFRCVGGGSSPERRLSLEKRARPLGRRSNRRRDVRLSLLRRRVDGNRSFRRVRVSPSARNRRLHSADRRSSLSRAREAYPRLRRPDTLFTVRHRRR